MRSLTVSLTVFAISAPVLAKAANPRNDTLTATIRQKGYSCGRIVSAQKDLGRSLQGRTLWYVECDDGNDQVFYKANHKPEVVKLITHKRPSR